MKKILFYCLILSFSVRSVCLAENTAKNSAQGWFNFVELKSAQSFSLYNGESEKNAFALDAGAKISLKNFDLRSYFSVPKTKFAEFSFSDFGGYFTDAENFRYGGGFSFFGGRNNFSAKAGMLSFSKSVSNLKSPAPSSSSSPLKKSYSFGTGLGSSLPSLTSSSTALSSAVKFSRKTGRITSFSTEFCLTENLDAMFSVYGAKNFGRFFSVRQSFTGGRFLLSGDSSYLKKQKLLFEDDFYFAGIWECFLSMPFLKFDFFVSLHQNPFENYVVSAEAKGRTALGFFLLDFAGFSMFPSKNTPSSVPLVGISSSVEKTLKQFSVNPQVLLPIGEKSQLRFGGIFVQNSKLAGYSKTAVLDVLKAGGGLSFKTENSESKCIFSAVNIPLFDENTVEIGKSYIPKKYYDLSLSYVCKFYEKNSVEKEKSDGKKAADGARKTSSDKENSPGVRAVFQIMPVRISFSGGVKFYPLVNTRGDSETVFDAGANVSLGKTKKLSLSGKTEFTLRNGERHKDLLEFYAVYKFTSSKLRTSLKCGVALSNSH